MTCLFFFAYRQLYPLVPFVPFVPFVALTSVSPTTYCLSPIVPRSCLLWLPS